MPEVNPYTLIIVGVVLGLLGIAIHQVVVLIGVAMIVVGGLLLLFGTARSRPRR